MKASRSLAITVPAPVAEWTRPTLDEIVSLASAEGLCLSFYLPAHRPGGQTLSTVDRFRLQLAAADAELTAGGISLVDVESLLAPLRALEQEEELQKGHHEALIILRSTAMLRCYRMPGLDLDQFFLGRHFHLSPLFSQLATTPDFYLLQLSRKRIHLLRVTLDGGQEVELPPGTPADYEQFKHFDQPDHTLRARSGASGGQGAQAPVAFGTGSEREAEQRHFHDFCRAIDRGLRTLLGRRPWPLVLAGTRPETTAYQAANTCPRLLEASIAGSPDGGTPLAEVIRQGRELLRHWVSPELNHVLRLYQELAGSTKALEELHAIVRAAAQGRVEYLAIATGCQPVMGNYDLLTERRLYGGEFVASHVDLVNAAIVDTLCHQGKVMSLPEATLPQSASVIAILRF